MLRVREQKYLFDLLEQLLSPSTSEMSIYKFIPHLTNPGLHKLQFLLNQLCMTYLLTKRDHSFIFSALKKTCCLKSML